MDLHNGWGRRRLHAIARHCAGAGARRDDRIVRVVRVVRANRRAPPETIATLDGFRDVMEELDPGLGVTDPVSGPVVLAMK